MARPLVKTHRIDLRLTPEEHEALSLRAGGAPLGPWLVRTALGQTAAERSATPRAALEAWERVWLPEVRRAAPLFSDVRRGLDLVFGQLRR